MNTKAYDLKDTKVAILATNGYEQSELEDPKKALLDAGAKVEIVSVECGEIKGWSDGNWSGKETVDITAEEAEAEHYDALLLPGGVMNPDTLRNNNDAVDFIRGFFADGKPVAAICHAPWTLINAGVAQGRRMTSYASIRADLQNAGAIWEDSEVVVDQALVTSRHPGDMDAFIGKMLEEFAEGAHKLQAAMA